MTATKASSRLPPPSAAVLIPVVEAPRYALIVGELTGGRRLLSDDLSTLESIALVAAVGATSTCTLRRTRTAVAWVSELDTSEAVTVYVPSPSGAR